MIHLDYLDDDEKSLLSCANYREIEKCCATCAYGTPEWKGEITCEKHNICKHDIYVSRSGICDRWKK